MKTINFSADLARQLHQVIAEHDPAAFDHGVAAHYLAATLGFWVAQQSTSNDTRADTLEQLYKLTVNLIHDIDQQQASASTPSGVQHWQPEP